MSIDALLRLPPERKAAIRAYTGHFPFMASEQLGVEHETLTLLRDPVERSVSTLKHFKRLYARYRELSLEEIYEDAFLFRHFVHNHQTKVFAVTIEDRSAVAREPAHARRTARLPRGTAPRTTNAGTRAASDTIVVDDERLALARRRLERRRRRRRERRLRRASSESSERRYGWWPAGLTAERARTSARSRGRRAPSCARASPATIGSISSCTSMRGSSSRHAAGSLLRFGWRGVERVAVTR